MGKNKQLKKLRKAAKLLPAMTTVQRARMQGSELIKKGINELENGSPVRESKEYIGNKPVPLNHYEQMKKAFMKAGTSGAANYAARVIAYANQKKQEADEAKAKEEQRKSAESFELAAEPIQELQPLSGEEIESEKRRIEDEENEKQNQQIKKEQKRFKS